MYSQKYVQFFSRHGVVLILNSSASFIKDSFLFHFSDVFWIVVFFRLCVSFILFYSFTVIFCRNELMISITCVLWAVYMSLCTRHVKRRSMRFVDV